MVTFLVETSYVKYNPKTLQNEIIYSAGVWDVDRSIALVMIDPDLKVSEDAVVMLFPDDPWVMYEDVAVYELLKSTYMAGVDVLPVPE
jgi:hypothetical protein